MPSAASKPAKPARPAADAFVLGAAVILAATFAAYLPALRAGFVWDDDVMLTNNAVIRAADGLRAIWFSRRLPDYFPLTSTTLWLEWRAWGLHAAGYHALNVLLHALSAVVLWRVLRQLRVPGAWVAALVFALHPVNVESVAWIAERKNTLAMFFYALALLCYLKFDELAPGARFRRWLYAGSVVLYALALLSKPAPVLLPFVLLACAWWRRGRITSGDVVCSGPFFGVALLLGLVTIAFRAREAVHTAGFLERLAGAGRAVWFYLGKALWPVHLSFVYPRWSIDAHAAGPWVPLAALVLVLVLLWLGRGGWGRPGLFALMYYMLMLLPVLGFVNVYFMKYSLVADHWQYFAIVGLIALGVGVLRAWLPRWAFGVAAAGLVLGVGPLTFRQAANYADEATLWRATLAANPAAWIAHGVLGDFALNQGNFAEAAARYTEVLRLRPKDATGHFKLGNVLAQQENFTEAIAHYRAALETKADLPEVHHRLGLILLQLGQPAGAVGHLEAAVAREPADLEARVALAVALDRNGAARRAITEYRAALRLAPDYAATYNNLAWLLATSPDGQVRDGAEAVRLAARACELTGGTNISALGTLAAAYAQAGQFTNAVPTALLAEKLARATGDTNLAAQTAQRVQTFREGKAVR